MDVYLRADGLELTERLYGQILRALSPLTSALSPIEQRRLQGLIERMLASSAA